MLLQGQWPHAILPNRPECLGPRQTLGKLGAICSNDYNALWEQRAIYHSD
jgi:hypothetical protein